jgi:hypothetical protein
LDNQELRCAEDIRAVVEAASMAVAPHTHFDLTKLRHYMSENYL